MDKSIKLSRNQWIRDMIKEGKSDDEILKLLEEGLIKRGIRPTPPPFNKVIYLRIKNREVIKEKIS